MAWGDGEKGQGFLWRSRLEHLPFDELFAPVKQGGLGLPNIAAKALEKLQAGLEWAEHGVKVYGWSF